MALPADSSSRPTWHTAVSRGSSCQRTGTAVTDTATAHDGTRSIRADGRAGYRNHVFVGTSRDVSGAATYARFFVRHTTALPDPHVTFLAPRDTRRRRQGAADGRAEPGAAVEP